MESWSYTYGGRGFGLDDSGNVEMPGISSELKSPWNYDQGCDQVQELVDLGSSSMMRKTLPNNSIGDSFASKISDERVISSVPVSANAFSCEDDSSSMFSSSVVESNTRDSLLIDLKLGRLNDQGDNKAFNGSVANANFSCSESSIPVKRARAGGLGSQTPYCQVYGCRKDLSSCKDYHKRHKVCEIHSKTTKVIVNGIEQRFCQQCSRFHLLPEFDDGKRSCRKRLAGHNERRRKPHIRIHAGRAGRLFQSFNTIRTEGNSLSSSSFICQDILSTCHLGDHNNSSRLVKLEDGTDLRFHLTNTDDVQQKFILTQHTAEKQHLSLQEDGLSVMTKCQIDENNSYFQDIADSSFVSHIAFPACLLGSENTTVLDSSFTNRGLSDIANSGRALSLLSSQSQCSTILTSGVPSVLPLISSGSRALFELAIPPEKLLGVGSQASTSAISSTFSSSMLSSPEMDGVGNTFVSPGGAVANEMDRILQQSAYMNSKNRLPFQQDPTIDLLQLSSQLERVEHQRQSSIMKHGDNDYSGFRHT